MTQTFVMDFLNHRLDSNQGSDCITFSIFFDFKFFFITKVKSPKHAFGRKLVFLSN